MLVVSNPQYGLLPRRNEEGLLNAIQGGESLLCKMLYQVVYDEGALVREGVELSTDNLRMIPKGEVIEVVGRQTNSTGLFRLEVAGGGFISESLNPLSGSSGPIVVPLLMWKPMNFIVVYGQGAVVRRGVELTSTIGETQSEGTEITVIDRQFSGFFFF